MEIKEQWGYTPLLEAVYYFNSKEVVWYLILKMPNQPPPHTASPFFAGPLAGELITKLLALHAYGKVNRKILHHKVRYFSFLQVLNYGTHSSVFFFFCFFRKNY